MLKWCIPVLWQSKFNIQEQENPISPEKKGVQSMHTPDSHLRSWNMEPNQEINTQTEIHATGTWKNHAQHHMERS